MSFRVSSVKINSKVRTGDREIIVKKQSVIVIDPEMQSGVPSLRLYLCAGEKSFLDVFLSEFPSVTREVAIVALKTLDYH